MEEEKFNKAERDHHKDSIVIEDRMPEIGFLFFMFLTFIPLIGISLWLYCSGRENDWTHITISLVIL
ncbi:hypothetical protein [Hydrogenimonas sp.]